MTTDDLSKKKLDLINQINEAQERLNDTMRSSEAQKLKDLKAAREQLAISEKGLRLQELENPRLKEYNDLLRERQALQKSGRDLEQGRLRLMQVLERNLTAEEKATNASTQAQRNRVKQLEKSVTAQTKLNEKITKGAKATGGFTSALNKAAGGTLAFATTIGGAMTKVLEMGFTLSDANAEIARQTGQVSGLNDVFDDLSLRVGENVMTLAEMKETVIGLNTTYGDFAFLSHDAQVEVAAFTGEMLRFGGQVNDTARILDFFGNTMSNSSTKAMGLTDTLKSLTRVLGRGLQSIQKDFIALIDPMTRFGDSAKKEFTEIAKFARSVGLETKAAFDVAEGFDTFASAAEKAGKLNAQFGTRLNSFAIMSLNHSERIKAIRAEFERSGIDVSQMGRREIQMLSEGFGIAEETARKFLNTRKSLRQITKEDEDANRRIADYMGAKQQIEIAVQNLFIENAHVIKDFVNGLSNVITKIGEVAAGTTAAANAIKGAIGGLMASPIIVGVMKVMGHVASFFTEKFPKMVKFVGMTVKRVLGPILLAKDLAQSMGFFADDDEQALAQQRLAAGAVGAGAAAATVSATGIGAISAPAAALFGYGLTREVPGLLNSAVSKPGGTDDPMVVPPGREVIPIEMGPKLDDAYISKDGTVHPLNEGDASLIGTDLGGMNKNQKMLVKELTLPLTLKVGSKDFVAGIATATDVILDTTTIR